ncbi:MAG: alpha/beta hydrolase [Pseudomonadota bacterium]
MTSPGCVARLLPLGAPFDDVSMGYYDWGDPGSEQTILCVHGLTRNAHDFDVLAADLSSHGARVIAVDVVGRGRSSWLSDPAGYAVPVYAAHLAHFLTLMELHDVDWVGTSMGGLIGMVLAASEQPPMQRLVLNDVGPLVPRQALLQIKAYVSQDFVFEDLEAVERHLRVVHATFGPLSDATWRDMAKTGAFEAADGWRLNYDPGIKAPYADLAEDDIDLWSLWDQITVPTLVLRGAESIVLPLSVAMEMTTRGPRAEVVTFDGVGHAPALVSPDQVLTVRRWLRR